MSISLHPDTSDNPAMVASPDAAAAQVAGSPKIRSRLFTKYVALFVAVVAVALLSNGIFEVFFYYREHKAALIRIQHEQAEAAAAKIGQFIKEIESQLGWTTQLPWSAKSIEDRRFDALRLLKQVPAITELAQVDSGGIERLRVSRLSMDSVTGTVDLSKDPKFTEAVANKVYYGPVYFRRESEPYMTLSLAGTRKEAGISIAEVNLKLIRDVVSQIRVGERGQAYVVDAQGRLIAHPDISLVLRNTDMSKLLQVQAARAGSRNVSDELQGTKNIQGQEVLTASAPIAPLGWTMFVELPVEEAYASLYQALQRLAVVLLGASILAVLAGIFLARRMIVPIQALRAGAERIGAGDFTQHISIKTGDEFEGLAAQFNDMGARLQESYSGLEQKVEARTAELSESLEQQIATSEVLRVISSSPGELEPVFEAMLENATRLCQARFGEMFLHGSDSFQSVALHGVPPALAEFRATNPPLRPKSHVPLARAVRSRVVEHVTDVRLEQSYGEGYPPIVALADLGGARTLLIVPLVKEDEVLGTINIYRQEVRPFTDKQIQLVTNFAAQAVIAIENTRLLKELRQRTDDLSESLEQQTATSEVLTVISASPGELQPVFQKMLENATRICGANFGMMGLFDNEAFRNVAMYNVPPAFADTQQTRKFQPHPESGLSRVVRTRQVVQIEDLRTQAPYVEGDPAVVALSDLGGARTIVMVPMLKEGELIGTISIFRQEVRSFSEKQIDLVANFAKQAVIAIENTRLLKELRQRTDDLTESLEQQTATSEVLQVISSSPGELAPVFQKMLENATHVCGANFGVMNLWDGNSLNIAADYNVPAAFTASREQRLINPHPQSGLGTVLRTRQIVQIEDIRVSPAYLEGAPAAVEMADIAGARTIVIVPMLKENDLIGTIAIFRKEVKPFTDKQIALLENFTKQAVIAIENTRLLKELRKRTDDLTESLEYQTATADVLNVISRSTTNVQPVFEAIANSAARLFAPCETTLTTVHDGQLHWGATASLGRPVEAMERVKSIYPLPFDVETSPSARAVHERRIIEIPDALAPDTPENTRRASAAGEFRSITFVPLLREGLGIGTIILTHPEAGFKLSPKQLALVQTFADQAVIAIENARLFDEVQAKTGELTEALTYQTGSGNILKVIASSPTDVKPALKAIVESACELLEADDALVALKDGNELVFKEQHGSIPVVWDRMPITRNWGAGRAVVDCKPIHVHDLLSSEGEQFPGSLDFAQRTGVRTVLSVPLMRENESIGAIVLRRAEVQPFSDKQITLLQTFADQAVIAIGNVRLFDEVQERTKEVSESLQFQTATSEVLKVISRSPDALQPVLDVIVKISQELCNSDASTIFLLRDGKFHVTAVAGIMPVHLDTLRANPASVDQPGSILARIAREKRTLHYANVADDPELQAGITGRGGPRTLLTVPLMRDGEVMGAITMRRAPNLPFSGRQIEAIEAFADQAVIAISNVGLFEQVQERTRELSQSLDELRTAQDRLVQTEKLASLGQLTAGIAHEIKNPLNFVNNFSALSTELIDELNDVLKPAELDDKTREEVDELTLMLKGNLEKVVQHGKRADSIVKNMLLHSREGSGEHRPVDINAIVEESLNLAYHGARAERSGFNITLQRDLDPEAGMIDLYPQEITRVFLNLISNGFYAATKRKEAGADGFEPTLSASTRSLGNKVEIRIRDNGTGIPLEVKEKMFNPFFTTKPAGEGTGLGLSMSHDIVVKQHGGKIDVDTEPGAFTEFIITLPRTAALDIQTGGKN
jgi:GAF domain-containing protein